MHADAEVAGRAFEAGLKTKDGSSYTDMLTRSLHLIQEVRCSSSLDAWEPNDLASSLCEEPSYPWSLGISPSLS